VDQDTISLIKATDDWSDESRVPQINLEPWDGSQGFVAISHVWADGLGNPRANALPRCQMVRLTHMVRSLSSLVWKYFWLDTICVPPDSALDALEASESQRQRAAQGSALTKMRQTYERSACVIVLDSWIISDAHKEMTDAEKLMRIFSSGWNTRLWTYQEGALAQRLFFQLRDELYDMDEAVTRFQNSEDWSLNYTLQSPLIIQYDSLRGFRHQKAADVDRIKHLATAL
jgi:hypothetical protein